jgi:hypothetical protein
MNDNQQKNEVKLKSGRSPFDKQGITRDNGAIIEFGCLDSLKRRELPGRVRKMN